MSDREQFTAEEIGNSINEIRSQLEVERRAKFAAFGIPATCNWPASRVFHEHSSLGPAWRPLLTGDQVGTLTTTLSYKNYPGAKRIALPHPPPLNANLELTIRSRRTDYDFSTQSVGLPFVAKLLELAAGVTEEDEVPKRAAPSGGALYPIETYVIAFRVDGLNSGVYHYVPLDHVLEIVRPDCNVSETKPFLPPALAESQPALILAFSIVFARTQMKYLERGYRFALLEVGHIAQNAALVATASDLRAVCVGGFWDEPFNTFLGFDTSQEAIAYSILVGR